MDGTKSSWTRWTLLWAAPEPSALATLTGLDGAGANAFAAVCGVCGVWGVCGREPPSASGSCWCWGDETLPTMAAAGATAGPLPATTWSAVPDGTTPETGAPPAAAAAAASVESLRAEPGGDGASAWLPNGLTGSRNGSWLLFPWLPLVLEGVTGGVCAEPVYGLSLGWLGRSRETAAAAAAAPKRPGLLGPKPGLPGLKPGLPGLKLEPRSGANWVMGRICS